MERASRGSSVSLSLLAASVSFNVTDHTACDVLAQSSQGRECGRHASGMGEGPRTSCDAAAAPRAHCEGRPELARSRALGSITWFANVKNTETTTGSRPFRVESPVHSGHGRLVGAEDVVDRFPAVGQELQGPARDGARLWSPWCGRRGDRTAPSQEQSRVASQVALVSCLNVSPFSFISRLTDTYTPYFAAMFAQVVVDIRSEQRLEPKEGTVSSLMFVRGGMGVLRLVDRVSRDGKSRRPISRERNLSYDHSEERRQLR